jgi:predicted transglutaminase-like cysteine proteinase
MRRFLTPAAALALYVVANLATAAASPWEDSMREGDYALAPFSFVQFCLDYPQECPKAAGPARVQLSNRGLAELANVNRLVNASIRPQPDGAAIPVWRLDVDAGDCNAYAVQKRHELIQRGWPAASLALAVVKTRRGEGHLVLTVRTDQGDLVLDNLRPNIVSWRRTGYAWIMRQSERNPQYWVELDGGRAEPPPAGEDFDPLGDVSQSDQESGAAAASAKASS